MNATQYAMPDSNVILSMLFPLEESQGNRNKHLLSTYYDRILARIVLLESFYQASRRVQRVWEIMRAWYHGASEYLYIESDSKGFKDAKKHNLRKDLKETKALTNEQIDNILFNLEKDRPAADVDREVKKFLDQIFSKLKAECSDYKIYPRRSLFPSDLANRSLPDLVDFWIEQDYRPFYTRNKEIREEIERSREMYRLDDVLRALSTQCFFASGISPDDRKIVAEYMMIRSQIANGNSLCLLTADESLRLLGSWAQLSLIGAFEFNVKSTQGTKKCGASCARSHTCPIPEY